MATRHWLERVRRAVVRSGLPAGYADRLASELRDHAEDCGDPAALGDPDAVAASAVAEYRRGRLAGRFPVLAQLLAPLLFALVGWVGYIHAGVWVVERFGDTHDPLSLAVAEALVLASRFVVPLAAVGVLWQLHRRSGRPRGWFAAGGAVVTVMAACYFVRFTPPALAADHEPELITALFGPASWWSVAQGGAVAAAVLLVLVFARSRCSRSFA